MVKKVVKKDDDKKLFAFLGVFLTVIGFIIAYATKKDDKYVMFYAKQGLVLFIASVVIWAFAVVPFIGWVLAPLVWLGWLVLWIMGLVYSLSGEMKEIPLIGVFANKFNF